MPNRARSRKVVSNDHTTKISQIIYEIAQFTSDLLMQNVQDVLISINVDLTDSQMTLLNETIRSSVNQAFDKSIENISKRIDTLCEK